MKIQVALDIGTLEENIHLIEKISTKIDIIEIGTPLIFHYGLFAVKEMRKAFPNHQILFDGKIVDAGKEESEMAFKAGANIVTVLSTAHDATIQAAISSAKKFNGYVLVDLIGQPNPTNRSKELVNMGVDYIGIHIAHDVQNDNEDLAAEFELLKGIVEPAKIAVAGGINPKRVLQIVPYHPGIIIVGKALTSADDPNRIIDEIYKNMEQ